MPAYVYIHGFNSGKGSRSASLLEQVLGAPIYCPENDYSQPFDVCIANLARQILENTHVAAGQLCVMGTSLGGFYALQLRLPAIGRVIAWNPVIYPALQLKGFVGRNTRFTDNKPWNFSDSARLSYACAADPREWNNFYMNRQILENSAIWPDGVQTPPRFVVLGVHDEVLEMPLAHAYWQDHARLLEIDSGHHVENFEHVLTLIE